MKEKTKSPSDCLLPAHVACCHRNTSLVSEAMTEQSFSKAVSLPHAWDLAFASHKTVPSSVVNHVNIVRMSRNIWEVLTETGTGSMKEMHWLSAASTPFQNGIAFAVLSQARVAFKSPVETFLLDKDNWSRSCVSRDGQLAPLCRRRVILLEWRKKKWFWNVCGI